MPLMVDGLATISMLGQGMETDSGRQDVLEDLSDDQVSKVYIFEKFQGSWCLFCFWSFCCS